MKTNLLVTAFGITLLILVIGYSIATNAPLDPTIKPMPGHAPIASTLEQVEPKVNDVIIATPSAKPVVTTTSKPKGTDLFSLVNYERQKRKIGNLKYSKVLEKTATAKACDIATRKYWSHTTPEGVTYDQFMRNNGATMFRDWGENISQKYTPNEAIIAWMASPTHKANIIDYRWVYAGIGSCGDVIVLHFAR